MTGGDDGQAEGLLQQGSHGLGRAADDQDAHRLDRAVLQDFLDGVDGAGVDGADEGVDLAPEHGHGHVHGLFRAFAGREALGHGHLLDALGRALAVPEGGVAQDVHGVHECRGRATGGHARAVAVGADVQLPAAGTDERVAADADGLDLQGPDQGRVLADGDAVALQQRDAVQQHGHVRGGAADVEDEGVLGLRGRAEDAHDRCGRAGKDGLHRDFPGELQGHGPAVGFDDVDVGLDVQVLEALLQGVGEGVEGAPDCRVVVDGANAPAEIQGLGHAVPLGHEVGLGGKGIGHGHFLLGVARAELADHAVDTDAFLAAARGHGLHILGAGLGRDGPAMVHAAREHMVLRAEGVGLGVDAGAGDDEHADLFGTSGDDGVGGEGRAQVEGADFRALAVPEDEAEDFGDGRKQVVVIRGHLGHGFHPAVPDADAVRVGSADIDSDKHMSDPWG